MLLLLSTFNVLTGKPTGKLPLGRPKVDERTILEWTLKKIGINARNWVNSAQDRDCWRALENTNKP